MAIYSYHLSRGQIRWQFVIDLPPAADGKRRQLNRKGFVRQEDAQEAETKARQTYGRADLAADGSLAARQLTISASAPANRRATSPRFCCLRARDVTPCRRCIRWAIFRSTLGRVARAFFARSLPSRASRAPDRVPVQTLPRISISGKMGLVLHLPSSICCDGAKTGKGSGR